MKYRRFGRTGSRCPSFPAAACATSTSGRTFRPAKFPAENQANLEACIHRALELGINHIETARGYGTSEMQLGSILPRLPREKSSCRPRSRPRPIAEEFLKTFERSLNYLRLDHVDLLALARHQQPRAARLSAFGPAAAWRPRASCSGRAGSGSSASPRTPPTDIILEAVNTGEFDYVNLHWYFVNDLNWPAVEAARPQDMGVFIISPNDKGGKLYEPPPSCASCARR